MPLRYCSGVLIDMKRVLSVIHLGPSRYLGALWPCILENYQRFMVSHRLRYRSVSIGRLLLQKRPLASTCLLGTYLVGIEAVPAARPRQMRCNPYCT